ncbi:MAG: hypothetical protein HY721_21360 [Planctomycetes bacterium]|nr:hypothetical protein [Planctomycetota bacterium]
MPVIGTQGSPYLDAGSWQLHYGYRYQKSDRHFTGDHEDKDRQREHSEVVNELHLMDFGLTHAFTKRLTATASLPVQFVTRSTPVRDANRDIIDRDTQRADGIGDMVVQGSMWVLDPDVFLKGNLQISAGVKLPTGDDDVRHKATIRNGSTFTREERTVDQSITPGDGSFGAIVAAQAFYTILEELHGLTLFAQGTYLFNPRGTNGVPTFRSRPEEAEMSVTDQYLAKAGVGTGIPLLDEYGFSCSVAGRIEGVPVHDAIGPDGGFRRPGYAVSVEPGIAWSFRGHTLGLSAPIAVYRNRQKSVPDKHAEPERHGDAAFADYLVLFSYSWVFAGPSKGKESATPPERPIP